MIKEATSVKETTRKVTLPVSLEQMDWLLEWKKGLKVASRGEVVGTAIEIMNFILNNADTFMKLCDSRMQTLENLLLDTDLEKKEKKEISGEIKSFTEIREFVEYAEQCGITSDSYKCLVKETR